MFSRVIRDVHPQYDIPAVPKYTVFLPTGQHPIPSSQWHGLPFCRGKSWVIIKNKVVDVIGLIQAGLFDRDVNVGGHDGIRVGAWPVGVQGVMTIRSGSHPAPDPTVPATTRWHAGRGLVKPGFIGLPVIQ